MDGFGLEPQFVDHAAPVWRLLPPDVRGTFYTMPHLLERCERRGIVGPVPLDADSLRRSSAPPRAKRGDGPLAFTVSIGDQKVARRLGYRRFVFMEHGCGQSYGKGRHQSYAGGTDREDNELFLVPNEYSADLWRRAYPAARVEIVGSPRLDDLPRRRIDPIEAWPVVAVSFHWPAHVHPYAGTAWGDWHRSLPELAKRYKVIGHAHPKGDWPDTLARYYRRMGIEFVRDFDEVCERADLYACDNSSSMFEFAATGRPVVVLNARYWNRKLSIGGRFWDWAEVGVNVDPVWVRGGLDAGSTTTALVDAVGLALEDPADVRERREDALRLVFANRGREATERAVGAVLDYLGVGEAVAA